MKKVSKKEQLILDKMEELKVKRLEIQEKKKEKKEFSELSKLLKTERKKQKITQKQLSLKLGKSRNYVSKFERSVSNFNISTISTIFEKGLNLKLNFYLTPIETENKI